MNGVHRLTRRLGGPAADHAHHRHALFVRCARSKRPATPDHGDRGLVFFYPLSIRGESSPRNCIVGVEVTEAGGNAVSPVAVRLSDEVLLRLAHCL